MSTPLLWPPPRRWEPVSGGFVLPGSWRLDGLPAGLAQAEHAAGATAVGHAGISAGLGPGAYRLRIRPDGILLDAGNEAGLRYGCRTLRQLAADGPFPCGVIEDAPAIAHRGVMLDISRDRIPTQRELHALIDAVADLKGNHLQLYCEHAFAYAGHGRVWGRATPITPEELKELDAHARRRGVVLGGNQNGLGHWERWFRQAPYDALAELDDLAAHFAQPEPGCLSLAPVLPAARGLVCDLIDQQAACLSGGIFNIGCDETADIGRGRSRDAVAARGFAAVYAEHVSALARHCLGRGLQPQFWADMALDHPDALPLIPAEAVALAWGYEADSDFARWGRVLASSGREWWACPGTAAWRSLGGRGDARRGSIAAAVMAVQEHGGSGILVTEWGDNGHRQQWPVAWLGLAEGLGAAWAGRGVADGDLPALSRGAFGLDGSAEWLHALSQVEVAARAGVPHPLRGGALSNASLPFIDSLLPWQHRGWQDQAADWHDLEAAYEECAWERPTWADPGSAGPGAARFAAPALAAECDHAVASCRLLARRALLRRTGDGTSSRGLAEELHHLGVQHVRLWDQRSRPGGRGDSLARWQRLEQEAAHAAG